MAQAEATKKNVKEVEEGTKKEEIVKAKKTETKPEEKVEITKEVKDVKTEVVKPEVAKSEEKIATIEEQREKETVTVEKAEEKKNLEKVYTIPLSDVYAQPWSKRARKAVRMVREFLQKHTKKEVKIASDVNNKIWSRGMKHPPRKIRVNVEIGNNFVTARLLK